MAPRKKKDDGIKPLDLTLRIIRSPVSILSGLKKSTKILWDDEAVKSSWKKGKTNAKEPGVTYPMDVWYLLSEYIGAEDVGRFARLCKGAQYVVDRPHFWISLYKRSYTPVPGLPAEFQPQTLNDQSGLRTRVIKALHAMHKPLNKQCTNLMRFAKVKNRQVISQWQQVPAIDGKFNYYLELEDINYVKPFIPGDEKPDGTVANIAENPREGRIILMIVCSEFVQIPLLVNLVLRDLKLVYDRPRLRHHSMLRCKFDYSRDNPAPVLKVNIAPVVCLNFTHWWNPCYEGLKEMASKPSQPQSPRAHSHPLIHPRIQIRTRYHDQVKANAQAPAQPLALVKYANRAKAAN